jgi:hypothetical protein
MSPSSPVSIKSSSSLKAVSSPLRALKSNIVYPSSRSFDDTSTSMTPLLTFAFHLNADLYTQSQFMMVVHVMITRHSGSMILTSSVLLLGPSIARTSLVSFQMKPLCRLDILWVLTWEPLAKCFLLTSNLSFCCRSPSRVIFL